MLLLLGLVYGLAGPTIGNTSIGLESRSATRQLAAGLRKARGLAVAEQRDAVLSLDVEARSFTVTGDPKVYSLSKRLDLALFTAQSELTRDQVGNIRFFPDGSSTGGRITVEAGDSKLAVDVDWVTGRVTLE